MSKYELGRISNLTEAQLRSKLVEAWMPSGHLKNLKGKDIGNMAVLCENQKKSLLKESATTGDISVFDTIAIPMIRRQYKAMITPYLVSMQPLSYSQGLAFYLDYRVSSTKKPVGKAHYANDLSGGQADDFAGNAFEDVSVYDRHYDNAGYDDARGRTIRRGWNVVAGSFDNSGQGGENDTAYAAVLSKNAVPVAGAAAEPLVQIIEFDLSTTDISLENLASYKLYDSTGTYIQGRDFHVQRTIQNYTDEITSTGRLADNGTTSTLGRDGGPGAPNRILRLRVTPLTDFAANTTINMRLGINEYLNLELNAAFSAEIKPRITKIVLQTRIWKLKTAWTMELMDDLAAYYSMDAEAELTKMLSEELAQEKDRTVMIELLNGAGHQEVWKADFYGAVDPDPTATVFRGTEANYNIGLPLAINTISEKIRKATQYTANYVVISPEGFAKMRNLDDFRLLDVTKDTKPGETIEFAGGIKREGTLTETIKVYVDPNMPAQYALVGRLGNNAMDSGYIYAPYIEFELGETIKDPQDGNPIKFIRSRVATKMVNNKFYGIVIMKGIKKYEVMQEPTTF